MNNLEAIIEVATSAADEIDRLRRENEKLDRWLKDADSRWDSELRAADAEIDRLNTALLNEADRAQDAWRKSWALEDALSAAFYQLEEASLWINDETSLGEDVSARCDAVVADLRAKFPSLLPVKPRD